MAIVTLPKPLREKLGEEGANALLEVLNQLSQDTRADVLTFVEEKFERRLSEEMGQLRQGLAEMENRFTLLEERFERRLSEETGKVNQRITEEVGKVNQRITEEMGQVNQRITEEMGQVNQRITEETGKLSQQTALNQATLIRWMFIFWVGQIAVLGGLFFAMFRLATT